MPWLGDDICMKDPEDLRGLSLAQWMNLQQNPSMANSMQQNYTNSLSGSVLQNLAGADLSRQLGISAPQVPHSNNLQFNAQRAPQQVQQLDQKSPLNPLGSFIQSQLQLDDISQQARLNFLNQTLPSSQVEAQVLQPQIFQTNNILQQQSSIQNHQLHRNLPQNLLQQQSQLPDQVNQNLQMSDNQIKLQLLQKLQQQQQSLLAQQSTLQQPAQLTQLQDQRQLIDVSQGFSSPMIPSQMLEMPQSTTTSLPQLNIAPQQMTKNNSETNVQFFRPPQQPKLQQQKTSTLPDMPAHVGLPPTSTPNQLLTAGSSILTGTGGAGQSGITDDVPSFSTSANNCSNVVQSNSMAHRSTIIGEDMALSATTFLSHSDLETMSSNATLVKDLQQKLDVKPYVMNISKRQNQGFLGPQTYLNGTAAQADYLDTSSSTTSICLSQNDVHIQHNNSLSYYPQSMLFRDTNHDDGEVQADPRNSVLYGINTDGRQLGVPLNPDPLLKKDMVGLGKEFSNNLSSGGILGNFENSKNAQQELSCSMVSQSFGVPDVTFNSIDSTINDSTFMDSGPWALPPQLQRMRTYTKVYKRGAVGRSIDITRYSGYNELKQDLARRFGIEGQLEDKQRIGWKLVYVDHENDLLLVGDDPWEEFVNCVRYIRILSPQEVQQMSLDGDFGNSMLPNQACSSSDGGNK